MINSHPQIKAFPNWIAHHCILLKTAGIKSAVCVIACPHSSVLPQLKKLSDLLCIKNLLPPLQLSPCFSICCSRTSCVGSIFLCSEMFPEHAWKWSQRSKLHACWMCLLRINTQETVILSRMLISETASDLSCFFPSFFLVTYIYVPKWNFVLHLQVVKMLKWIQANWIQWLKDSANHFLSATQHSDIPEWIIQREWGKKWCSLSRPTYSHMRFIGEIINWSNMYND